MNTARRASFIGRGAAALALLFWIASTAAAQPLYYLTDLGVNAFHPDFTFDRSSARGLSENGLITGILSESGNPVFSQRAFVWNPGTGSYTTVINPPTSGSGFTIGNGINNAGRVVGDCYFEVIPGDPSSAVFRGFHHSGSLTVIAPSGSGDITSATAVNNNGLVTGFTNTTGSGPGVAYTYNSSTDTYSDILPTFASGTNATGQAVSDSGHVAGRADVTTGVAQPQRAFRWQAPDASLTAVPLLPGVPGDDPGFFNTFGLGVNEAGHVVGEAAISEESGPPFFDPAQTRAYLWTGSGAAIDLGVLAGSDTQSAAYDVNNLDQIVGQSFEYNPSTGAFVNLKAFLLNYSGNPGSPGTMLELSYASGVIDSTAENWNLEIAVAINDMGWIIGTGTDPNGNRRGYLLRPISIPEPTAIALGAICLCGAGTAWRRRRLKQAAVDEAKLALEEMQ